jgi:hypothetical protein
MKPAAGRKLHAGIAPQLRQLPRVRKPQDLLLSARLIVALDSPKRRATSGCDRPAIILATRSCSALISTKRPPNVVPYHYAA